MLVRGKAGAPCEFGNGLRLAESPHGLLIHWEFFKESPLADSSRVSPVTERVKTKHNIKVQSLAGDPFLDTKENAQYLKDK